MKKQGTAEYKHGKEPSLSSVIMEGFYKRHVARGHDVLVYLTGSGWTVECSHCVRAAGRKPKNERRGRQACKPTHRLIGLGLLEDLREL